MKKRILTIIMFMLLAFVPSNVSFAESSNGTPRLVDDADLLSDTEEEALLSTLDTESVNSKCDIIIVTTNESVGSDAEQEAADFVAGNDFGIGKKQDAVILYISMYARDWSIMGTGSIERKIRNKASLIGDEITPELSSGDYYGAFVEFIDQAKLYIKKAHNAKFTWIPIALGIGMIISILVMLGVKSKLKSVHSQPAAASYLVKDSFKMNLATDRFMYSHIKKTAIPKSNSSSTSSGGRSFSGSSGKF